MPTKAHTKARIKAYTKAHTKARTKADTNSTATNTLEPFRFSRRRTTPSTGRKPASARSFPTFKRRGKT